MSMFESAAWTGLVAKVRDGLMVWTHSGKVRPGDVFVAVPGTVHDGAKFIPHALENGAKYVVARSADNWPAGTGAQLVIHPDPAEALGELAAAYFRTDERKFKLVGITGTNGKTTISYLIEYILASCGMRVGVLGTVNYRWPGVVLESQLTTPDCWKVHELLANMGRSEIDVAVMEVSSHALDQNRVAGLKFDVGVITNLTQDHLDYHGDMQTYFAAKSKLFTDFAAPGMTSVVNYDDPNCARLLDMAPGAVGYGLGDAPEGAGPVLRGELASMTAAGMHLKVSYGPASWEIDSSLVGRHNAENLLGAQGAGLALGLSPEDMARFAGFHGVPGRLERVPNERGLNIFVDYAHTPDALENVLSSVKGLTRGRLFAVFGCGGDRDRTKRPLMGQAVARHADVAVLTSDNPRSEEPLAIMEDVRPGLAECPRVIAEADRREAIRKAIAEMTPDDVLVVAGKGHEVYQQIGDLKFPFHDPTVVKELLECA